MDIEQYLKKLSQDAIAFLDQGKSLKLPLIIYELKIKLIKESLQQSDYSVTEAAIKLNLSRTTLVEMINRFNLYYWRRTKGNEMMRKRNKTAQKKLEKGKKSIKKWSRNPYA